MYRLFAVPGLDAQRVEIGSDGDGERIWSEVSAL